jgi:hypothetical protein
MESKVAKEAERALVEATQRLSPEERLNIEYAVIGSKCRDSRLSWSVVIWTTLFRPYSRRLISMEIGSIY